MSSNGASPQASTTAGVLICDDNAAIRRLLRAIVDGSPGLGVVGEASDGNEAIVETKSLQPDVILLDLAMPVRSGLEALPELRRFAPNAQIIVLSGFASTIAAEEVLALGAAGYLEKGASPDTIVGAIEQAVANTPGSVTSLVATP